MARILIIEDVAGLRQHAGNIVRNVDADAELYEADNGLEGLKIARTASPDLIIMDISMPQMNGIKAAQQIWSESPARKILFWSQYHREAYVRELGKIVPDEAIHGYALKSESDEKLEEAVRSILLHDNPYIDPLVRGVQARMTSKDNTFTDVECETLMDIALGLTDKAIAQRRHISVRGVQNRLSLLMEKLIKGEDTQLRESVGMEIFNARTRVVFEAIRRGLIDTDEVNELEKQLEEWMSSEFSYERPAIRRVVPPQL